MKSARKNFWDTCWVINFGCPFGCGAKDCTVIHLLKGFAFAHAALDLTDKDDQRGRILFSDVNAG